MNVNIIVHAHFYQPWRLDPWLNLSYLEPSASPWPDWTSRIHDECYGKLHSLHDFEADNRSLYRFLSWDIGPYLLEDLKRRFPKTYKAFLEASAEHMTGPGATVGMPLIHSILPLSSPQERQLNLKWGHLYFRHRFKTPPLTLWLPELAVDVGTLRDCLRTGYRLVIVSPSAVKSIIPPGHNEGFSVSPEKTLWTFMPYRVNLGNGDDIIIVPYHPQLSSEVAFGSWLNNFEGFLSDFENTCRNGLDWITKNAAGIEPTLVLAFDGETFGHHHSNAISALDRWFTWIMNAPNTRLINTNTLLETLSGAKLWSAELHPQSSWSCPHGFERWRTDCGCRFDNNNNNSQAWRAPLRQAFTYVQNKVDEVFLSLGQSFFHDPMDALIHYPGIRLYPSLERIEAFKDHHLRIRPDRRVRHLLEMAWFARWMWQSDAWFFESLIRLEPLYSMLLAYRAAQLAEYLGSIKVRAGFLELLAGCPTGRSHIPDGAKFLERYFRPWMHNKPMLSALHVLRRLLNIPSMSYFQVRVKIRDRETSKTHGYAQVLDRLTNYRLFGHFTLEQTQDSQLFVWHPKGSPRVKLESYDFPPSFTYHLFPQQNLVGDPDILLL